MREQKALEQFTRQLAKELAVKQITINAVPEDIANVIEFLTSEQSQWITGQTIRVNGGLLKMKKLPRVILGSFVLFPFCNGINRQTVGSVSFVRSFSDGKKHNRHITLFV